LNSDDAGSAPTKTSEVYSLGVADFDRALEIDPDSAEALKNRRMAEARKGSLAGVGKNIESGNPVQRCPW
jgi:hypothetical protein